MQQALATCSWCTKMLLWSGTPLHSGCRTWFEMMMPVMSAVAVLASSNTFKSVCTTRSRRQLPRPSAENHLRFQTR